MPTAGDLCTLADVKAWQAIVTLTEDSILERLIAACSAGIKDYVQRPLLSAIYTETYDGTGTSVLLLKNYPITDVSAVSINGVAVAKAASTTEVGFVFNQKAIYLTGRYGVIGAGNQNVTVTYTAGYASIPYDITQACIEFVCFKYNQRKHTGRKTDNITAGGMGTSYQEGYMPPEVKMMLNKYRRLVPS